MKRRSITALLGVSCLAVVLVSGPKASAQAECPYLYTECPVLFALASDPPGFTTNQFAAGETFGLFGINFPTNERYVIFFDQNPTIRMGSATANGQGGFVVELTIPNAAADGAAALIARPADANSGLPVATLGLLITDDPFRPQADPPPGGGGGGGAVAPDPSETGETLPASDGPALPITGTDIAVFGTYGAMLLAAGWALMIYARRRRPAPSLDPHPAYSVPDLLPADWSEPLIKA